MESCDVLIVGGGPAGSTCAWKLRHTGLDVAILDKARFPRDKTCGGWITRAVLDQLHIDASEYAGSRVLQTITGFRTGIIGGRELETTYGRPVSYGIRRCEFDAYLLGRAGGRVFEGVAVQSIERSDGYWVVNRQFRAKVLVGAGGHFCPVARLQQTRATESAVVAKEIEVEMDAGQAAWRQVRGEVPEIFFCPDFTGYGWCFRKQNFLNVGLGRLDHHNLPQAVSGFVSFLKTAGKVPFDLPENLHGHAYLLGRTSRRIAAADGLLLVGDSAGLAYAQSGEGILPAVASGLLAAETILGARGDYRSENLESYRTAIREQFGASSQDWATKTAAWLPSWLLEAAMRRLMRSSRFVRGVVLDGWFLHAATARTTSPVTSTRQPPLRRAS